MQSGTLQITAEPPDSETAKRLIHALDEDLGERYPAQFIHGLHPEDLLDPHLFFAVARLGDEPIGCGALRKVEPEVAEIKRMFVLPGHRGRGYSREILTYLEARARAFGYRVLRLETGTEQPESLGLYRSSGYREIPCYGEYVGNPYSLCLEKHLA